MAQLTPRKKNWLYYNLKKFHSEDQYLKHLNTKVILSSLKYKIYKCSKTDELYEELDADTFTTEFKFYRKEGKYFSYPSLRDQVISLMECWEELRNVYLDMYSGSEAEYEQFDNEPFSEHKEIASAQIKRTTFGNKLNVNSIPHLKEEASFFRHVMSSNKFIKSSFGIEYHFFKKRCLKELSKVEERDKLKSYFFQTDLRSFFHQLQPETILKIIEDYPLDNLKKWILKIVKKDSGLPIGWILSGIVSDLLMVEFSKFIFSNKGEICKKLNITKFEMITYVDDLVFFIGSKNKIENRLDFLPKICSILQEYLDEFFKGSNIEIHKPDSIKVKFLELDKALASVLKTNWHDIEIFVSGDDLDLNKGWSILDDFLLPGDNDLVLNEKVQFFSNLKNLKSKIINDEINTVQEFRPYFDKIFYKISIDKKYLATAFDIVFTFLQRNNIDDPSELINDVWKKLMDLEDSNSLDIIQFIKRYSKYGQLNGQTSDEMMSIITASLLYVNDEKKFKNSEDSALLASFLKINFVEALDGFGSLLKKESKRYYFYDVSALYQEYFALMNKPSKADLSQANPFLCSEIIQIQLKGQVKTSQALLDRIRKISLNISGGIKRQTFISALFEDLAFNIVPYFNKESLEELVNFFNENRINSPLVDEIENIHCNYDKLFELFLNSQAQEFSSYARSLVKVKDYKYKRPKCLPFEILKPEQGKMYVFYKEIVTCILFSVATVSDALKFVLFQYKPIESTVFISWQALPSYFNGVSDLSLALTKDFFRKNIKGLLYEKRGHDKLVSQMLSDMLIEEDGRGNGNRLRLVNLDSFDKLIAGESKKFERFSKNNIKLMVANLEINIHKDFSEEDNLRLLPKKKLKIHGQILNALKEAVLRKCDVICFPELTLPLEFVPKYLEYAGKNNLILIGGVEYIDLNSNNVVNPSIISLPTRKAINPLSRNYHAYIQFKNFISIKEIHEFETKVSPRRGSRVEVVEGKEIQVFKDSKVNQFAILSCSDFLSLELKYRLQGMIQTVFVPAMNFDNTTYYHVAQAAIRELYCICVVCNNSFMGASLVCAPFRKDHERTMFKIEGKSYPKGHYLSIHPNVILELQQAGKDKFLSFENNETPLVADPRSDYNTYKQPPPDWYHVMNNKKGA